MLCHFKTHNNKVKKCECIVYCQKVDHKPLTWKKIVSSFYDTTVQINIVYYVLFAALMFVYLFSGQYCDKWYPQYRKSDEDGFKGPVAEEPATPDAAPEQLNAGEKSIVEQFCAQKESANLNIGVMFLVFAAFRAYYKKINDKVARSQK